MTEGPYGKWPSVSDFHHVSERAYELFHRTVDPLKDTFGRPVQHLFLRIAYQAETTSVALRNANTWALCLPALALTRVRLEQAIVCSYLIHEDESIALLPFVSHIPVGEYRGIKAALEDADLAERLAPRVDADAALSRAIDAQQDMDPDFDIANDKLSRSWTTLDLRSMARNRDALVAAIDRDAANRLEPHYLSIYKVASSIVHADGSSLSYRFMDISTVEGLEPVLMANPNWAQVVAASTAHYDILQIREILGYLGCAPKAALTELSKSWHSASEKHI
jgi:hypothetical protein